MIAVDTNVFVYYVDTTELIKRPLAIDLIQRLSTGTEETVLLWQVAGEFLAYLRRKEDQRNITREQTTHLFDDIAGSFRLVAPTLAVAHRALDLSGRHSLSHWDSMLLRANALFRRPQRRHDL